MTDKDKEETDKKKEESDKKKEEQDNKAKESNANIVIKSRADKGKPHKYPKKSKETENQKNETTPDKKNKEAPDKKKEDDIQKAQLGAVAVFLIIIAFAGIGYFIWRNRKSKEDDDE